MEFDRADGMNIVAFSFECRHSCEKWKTINRRRKKKTLAKAIQNEKLVNNTMKTTERKL